MKTKTFVSTLAIVAAMAILGACADGVTGAVDPVNAAAVSPDLKSATVPEAAILTGAIADVPITACVVTGTVNEAETAGLLFMREEEKLARDVYAYMYAKYKLPVFLNISKSENAHVSAILRLMTGFGIADNSSNTAGVYVNPQLTDLYKQLITMGNLSVNDALKVGVLIEQTDITDLQKELLSVQNSSIKTVYTNLMAGSNAHLKAFTWNLKIRGIIYP
jgi:hypothetical protein